MFCLWDQTWDILLNYFRSSVGPKHNLLCQIPGEEPNATSVALDKMLDQAYYVLLQIKSRTKHLVCLRLSEASNTNVTIHGQVDEQRQRILRKMGTFTCTW